MKIDSLPQSLRDKLPKGITAAAKSDLASNRKFSDGYVTAAGNKITVSAAKHPRSVMLFRGILSQTEENEWEQKTVEAKRLDIVQTVSGGILYAETASDDEVLCYFTNRCYSDMQSFADGFNREHAPDRDDGGVSPKREGAPSGAFGGSPGGPPGGGPRGPGGPGGPPHGGGPGGGMPSAPENEEEAFCPKCGTLYPDPARKVCPKCMDKRSIFFKTLGYFKPYKWKIAVMLVSYLLTAALNLVWPYLNGTILYDRVLAKDEGFLRIFGFPAGQFAAALGLVVITMVITKLTLQVLSILQGVMSAKIVPDVVKSIKSDVFKSMGRLSIGFYNSSQTGSLMTRIVSDADRVTSFFLDGLPNIIINAGTVIATAVMLISLNAPLGVLVIVFIPPLFLFSVKMLPALWSLFGRRHRSERSLNSQIHDNIMGARVVKSFGKQKNETERFDKYNRRVQNADMAIVRFDNRFNVVYGGMRNLLYLMSFAVGAYMIVSGRSMTFGTLITFTSYVNQLSGPMDFFARVFRLWADSMNAAQRLFEIIDAVPDITEKENPVVLDKLNGDIELRNVTFGYEPHRPVLKNISLKIEGGKMLGIVGRSGAGKSTLVNLILRLYDPDEGEILLDGVNVKDLSFEQIRKNVAMVSQETYVFIGTVAENIAYSNPNATREEIINAAMLASAHDFICKMPDGYDTVIGSSGRTLSGGERQRISIARAVLANPKILILDEATASVDTETEKAIQKSIDYLIKGRTTISIAHRLSTLRDAQKLAVIDDGRLTEQGTAKELWEQKGTYYKLRELQTKALAMKGLE